MPAVEYAPRDPSASAIYAVVRAHVEEFLAEATRLRDGDGVPRFVEKEFRAFLRCGFLAGGFARFRCPGCTTERLVAFSCKGRGFCPSCGGRRMAERAAHLVDHVLRCAGQAVGADAAASMSYSRNSRAASKWCGKRSRISTGQTTKSTT